MQGSSQRGLRQYNERTVLHAIRSHGAMPKAELARLTGLSAQAVSLIVEGLETDALLVRQAPVRGKVGQPSVPLALNPDGAYSVGVQVGRRGVEMLVVDFTGQVREKHLLSYPYPDPDVILPHVGKTLAKIKRRLGERWSRVVGLGLSAPLFMHQWSELLGPEAAPALARWEAIDLPAQVSALCELDVVFAKDTLAACTAELLLGRGRSLRSFLYIFIGTFVGGGLVLSGHLLPGEHGNAGAIGSMHLGTRGAGAQDQLVGKASGWLLEQSVMRAGLDPLQLRERGTADPAWVLHTQAWVASAADALASAIGAAVALLDLDAVVIDGSFARPLMTELVDATRVALDSVPAAGTYGRAQILLGEVGRHARATGGALLPMHAQFFPDKDLFLKAR